MVWRSSVLLLHSLMNKPHKHTDPVHEKFFKDARLLGITSSFGNVSFLRSLKSNLNFDFRIKSDWEITLQTKGCKYYFAIYKFKEPGNFIVHYLYENYSAGQYLFPEFSNLHFIWLMKGQGLNAAKLLQIKNVIEGLDIVESVKEITAKQIWFKNHIAF